MSAPLRLAHVRPHLDAVSNLGPVMQDSVQQSGVSQWRPPRWTRVLEEMMDGERLKDLLTLERKRLRVDPAAPFSYLKGINGEALLRGAQRQSGRQ